MHDRMMELFREYIVVGGMPAAVRDFVTNHNFANVLRIQKEILSDYTDDIAKYAEGAEKVKSADNTKSKSLDSVMRYQGVPGGIRLSSKNVGEAGNIGSFPLYMAMFLLGLRCRRVMTQGGRSLLCHCVPLSRKVKTASDVTRRGLRLVYKGEALYLL